MTSSNRSFKDLKGIFAYPAELNWKQTYKGFIEMGSYQGANRIIFERFQSIFANRPWLLHGFDLSEPPDEPIPGETVWAELHSNWVPPDKEHEAWHGRTELILVWFQEKGSDIFSSLRKILSEIDWSARSSFEIWD